jgi:hypothetical protein
MFYSLGVIFHIDDKTKYRLLVDIAVAYGRQNKEQEASEYLIDNILFIEFVLWEVFF